MADGRFLWFYLFIFLLLPPAVTQEAWDPISFTGIIEHHTAFQAVFNLSEDLVNGKYSYHAKTQSGPVFLYYATVNGQKGWKLTYDTQTPQEAWDPISFINIPQHQSGFQGLFFKTDHLVNGKISYVSQTLSGQLFLYYATVNGQNGWELSTLSFDTQTAMGRTPTAGAIFDFIVHDDVNMPQSIKGTWKTWTTIGTLIDLPGTYVVRDGSTCENSIFVACSSLDESDCLNSLFCQFCTSPTDVEDMPVDEQGIVSCVPSPITMCTVAPSWNPQTTIGYSMGNCPRYYKSAPQLQFNGFSPSNVYNQPFQLATGRFDGKVYYTLEVEFGENIRKFYVYWRASAGKWIASDQWPTFQNQYNPGVAVYVKDTAIQPQDVIGNWSRYDRDTRKWFKDVTVTVESDPPINKTWCSQIETGPIVFILAIIIFPWLFAITGTFFPWLLLVWRFSQTLHRRLRLVWRLARDRLGITANLSLDELFDKLTIVDE